jgi:predicted SnoaL-like aldol condensation-catalyzing enzyme
MKKPICSTFLILTFFTLGIYAQEAAPGLAENKQEKQNKALATEFMTLAFVKKDLDAAILLMNDDYIQHNPFAASGKAAFKQAISGMLKNNPNLKFEIKHVYVDGNYVIFHSLYQLNKDDRGSAVVDILRVENGKIAEHWDVGQRIPEKSANDNGMF